MGRRGAGPPFLMRDKRQNLLILLGVAALVVAAAYFIWPPGSKTHLGLDLQGGLEVVYKATLEGGGTPTTSQIEKTVGILDRRVNGLGVTESQIQQQGSDQISVALPGVRDVEQALSIIGKTAQLKFYDDGLYRVSGPSASVDEAVKTAVQSPPAEQGLTAADKKEIKTLSDTTRTSEHFAIVTAAANKLGDNAEPVYFVYRDTPILDDKGQPKGFMTGVAIKSASQAYDQYSKPDVEMNFTSEGAKQFGAVTKDLAVRGALKQQSQTFAIVLDNQMESDPQVDYNENPNGIQGSSALITGNFTVAEAKDLALVLNTGALPVTLQKIESQEVSATLGKDSLRQGLFAGLIGLGIVLVYLIAYYRFLGVVADLALIVYAILLWGLFNAIPVTLTLPGIAGMILTIGVAADANVVIFERIKEEMRHGRTVRSAISAGYGRGFRTILDANILTLLTALVLFIFATAQPRGFAFTLMLGVLVSMLTAVLATRAMLGLLSDYEFFNKASFMGVKPGDIVAEEPEKPSQRRPRRTSTSRRRKR
jgi:protein-export membrane protein SecD